MATTEKQENELKLLLTETLPKCLEECHKSSEQLIVDGHKELEQHLLNKCDNVSKEELSNVKIICLFRRENKLNVLQNNK